MTADDEPVLGPVDVALVAQALAWLHRDPLDLVILGIREQIPVEPSPGHKAVEAISIGSVVVSGLGHPFVQNLLTRSAEAVVRFEVDRQGSDPHGSG